jgi:hypothetical protein
VLGCIHVPSKAIEGVTVHFGRACANVEHIKPVPGSQGERKL